MYYGVDNTKAICHWKYVRREKKTVNTDIITI